MSAPVLFFFNDTATTEIYTLSLHDALPISSARASPTRFRIPPDSSAGIFPSTPAGSPTSCKRSRTRWRTASSRSEEHTSELQSRQYLVCRLLLEKKKKISFIKHRRK